MVGALVGDLAAWTYEHDRDLFFRQLVADDGVDAQLSAYSKALLNAASYNLLICPWIHVEPEMPTTNKDCYVGQWVMWQIVAAWKDRSELNAMPSFVTGKQEFYAGRFVRQLIRSLRNGATKSEAYYSTFSFEDLSKTWKWKTEKSEENIGILTYIFRAWDSFYRAFDFTSTIHNAVKWPGDKHLTAAIAGAFADAMYGCEISYIKKKYAKGSEPYHRFNINVISENNGYHHALVMEMFNHSKNARTFYPKNNALTNVELHTWLPVMNIFENISFSDEEHKSILLSAPTGWDCRYGLYLDDGWICIYRSHVLIGRFQMQKLEEQWFIINPQLSGEMPFKSFCIAIGNALYEGCRVMKPEMNNTLQVVEQCKYFNGETDVPQQWKHEINGNFWYGEMMFCKGHKNLQKMTGEAEDIRKNYRGEKLFAAMKYKPEQFAILLYIENLYAKWHPYDSLDWIYCY